MPEYIDPAHRGRAAIVALACYIAAQAAEMATAALTPADGMAEGIASLALFVGLIAAMVATAFWVYRVNANAHAFADGLSITPGWNVGWFFVPVANLWKPFEGIRETWQASRDPAHWAAVPVPGLLRAWWGCWIIGNLLANGVFQLERRGGEVAGLATSIDLVSSAFMIVAAGCLIRIIAELSRMQPRAHAEHTFA